MKTLSVCVCVCVCVRARAHTHTVTKTDLTNEVAMTITVSDPHFCLIYSFSKTKLPLTKSILRFFWWSLVILDLEQCCKDSTKSVYPSPSSLQC